MDKEPQSQPFLERFQKHPLTQQVKGNLNRRGILGIVRGGPERWWHVMRQARTKVQPDKLEKEAIQTEAGLRINIEKANLEPIVFNLEYGDISIVSIGCHLPSNHSCSLIVPYNQERDFIAEADQYLSKGRYLLLPATTSEDHVPFNNGSILIGPNGHPRQITSKIEPFKGSIGLAFYKPNEKDGQLKLLSQSETQDVLTSAESAKALFPSGAFLLGAPSYGEFISPEEPSMAKAITIAAQNRYFGTYNNDTSCYIQTSSGTYFFNNILQKNPGNKTFMMLMESLKESDITEEEFKKFTYDIQSGSVERILLGVFAALYAASKVSIPDTVTRIALAEQNYTGYLSFIENKKDQGYYHHSEPMIALKL